MKLPLPCSADGFASWHCKWDAARCIGVNAFNSTHVTSTRMMGDEDLRLKSIACGLNSMLLKLRHSMQQLNKSI